MIAYYIKALINKRKLIIITYRTNTCVIEGCGLHTCRYYTQLYVGVSICIHTRRVVTADA